MYTLHPNDLWTFGSSESNPVSVMCFNVTHKLRMYVVECIDALHSKNVIALEYTNTSGNAHAQALVHVYFVCVCVCESYLTED